MAPTNKNPNMTKKQTGTVPKASSTSTTSVIPAQNKTAGTGKTSSSRKNTEIVAPTRRELNDLNDYLLSVAESTKQENSRGHTTHLDPTCFELDNLNFQENQRSCWPVRPIPRRNIINKKSSSSGVQQGSCGTTVTGGHPTTTNVGHHTNYLGINNNTVISTASNINHPAAIGVVIPTTPNSTVLEDSFNLNRVHSNLGNNQIHLNGDDLNSNHQIQQQLQSNINFDNDLSWEQRLNFIQYFLSLTSKSINKTSNSSLLYNLQFPLVDLCLKNSNHKMVNEYKDGDIYMNSTSLEDVAHSEASDTRAQSVTSIHTNAPETPSYEDLQTRLEASNRNIQNIKDQQQQLIQLQQSAKQHLSEMESIRNQHNKQPARYNQNGSGGGPPNYETVEQVHSDMSNLVNRMKNLQNFIHGQNELSAMLGDDGPEIMAEQEALQKKLEELKSQKQDMKNLVSELQEINNSAERSLINQQSTEENVGRSVPIDYERVVPIEMVGATKQPIQQNGLPNGHYHNGVSSYNETSDQEHLDQNIDEREEAIAETNDMIAQKIADINTMKSQLKRLKDMMETVSLIEAKNDGKTAKEIADEGETPTSTLPPSVQIPIVPKNPSRGGSIPADKDESATATTEEEAVMSERVRLLHEMTQDLRDQAVHLSSERDRLKAIKDEMQRRKEMESAINHDKIPNRQPSLDRIPNNAQQSKESDKHLIKEFEAKKKEFEKLCQRLQNEDELVRDEEVESIAPDGTETGELKRENASYYPDNWRQSHIVSSNSSVHGKQSAVPLTPTRGKDSADSGAVDVHGVASLEGGSFQSGSSRSFSMPPPMRNITRDTPWRKNSQDNNSQSQFDHYAPPPPPLPAWNPSFYYSTPYSQQFSPPCHHHMMMSANNNAASEYFCPHQFHSNAVNSTISTATQQQQQQQQVSTQNTGVTSSDPVLLQQFIQTQQMLINSVCQCNQLLWHQQREINNLNNAVLLLQERLLNSNTSDIAATLNASIRAESVPPTGVTVSNNLYTQANRAQSEQPHPGVLPSIQPYSSIQQHGPPPPPPMSPGRQYQSFNYATNSYQQHNRRHMTNILQQNHVVPGSNHSMHSSNSAYNFSATEAAATTGYCSQLPPPHGGVSNSGSQSIPYNNTNVHHQGQTNFLNNDVLPNGPPPPPIFMHHHNNTITPSVCNANVQQQQQQPQPHHNNSNLNIQPSQQQQQNCLNSPSMNSSRSAANINAAVTSSAPNTTNSNAADVAAALNNQVPPGNRANNYWDNFRSYSRQNLLSSNSCKSNEEQQHQHQQQQQQHLSTSLFGTNSTSLNTNGIRNLHYLNIGESSGNSSTNSINLTPPIFDNKYSHTFRNQFNNNIVGGGGTTGSVGVNVGNVQHPQELNTVMIPPINNIQNGPTNILNSIDNMEIIETNQPQQQLQHQSTSNNINNINNNNNNNNNHNNINNNLNNNTTNSNNVAAIFGSSDFRNMNFNFGINESRKKLPFKTSCNTKRLRHTQQMLNDVNNVVGPNQRYPGNHDGNNDIIGINNNNNNNNNTDFYIRQGLNNGQSSSSSTSLLRDNHTNMMSERMSDNMNEVVSEEIKRNLLVNALKSDKFTSKFFESLKEDVYREVYTIIQATESHPYYLMQLFKELQLISSSDPLRNIVIQAMHDLYKRSCTNNQSGNNEETLLDQHENYEDLHENQSQPPTQSSYENDFENLHSNNNDNEIMNSLLNSQELRRLAYKIMFESSTSPTRIDKTKKMDIKKTKTATKSSSTASPKFQYVHEIYRPNYELINQIMSDIRNLIFTQQQQQQQKIDDDLMIRIAKLTYTSLENHELTMNTEHNNYVQIDRHLIIPKELYRKMRTFDISNCDGFLSCYESYLQTLFIMKCINDDTINNVNLINKTPTATTAATSTAAHDEISIDMNPSSSSTSSLINENDQKSRRHSQITSHKSNIPINSIELNLGLNKKIHHDNNDGDCSSSSINMASCSTSTQDSSQQTLQHNPHHCHSQNLITSSDISLIFGNGIISSSGQSTDQISSPCTSNNMMNEDLAEADQICSTSSTTNSCSLVLQPLQNEGNPNPIESRCSTTTGRGSFSLEHPIKRPLIEDYLDEHEIIGEKEKKDCGGIGGNINHNNCSSNNNNNNNNMKMNGGGGSSLTYQTNYNREAQVNSNARREMDEDGFDVFGKVGGSTTAATTTTTTSSIFGKLYQNNGPEVMITNNCVLNPMSTVSSIDSDIGNNNPDIVGNCVAAIPIMNDAACAVVYATSSNSSLDTTSTINLSNSLSDSNSNGINHNNMILTNNHNNNPCGGGGDTTTKQRNSVP